MEKEVLDRFFAVEAEKYGSAEYAFKGDKLASKIRAFYARPFCPRYMQSFSTSMYPDTFFAEKKRGRYESCLETEFHENVHKWDRWKQGIKFSLKYTFPHWVGLPFILAAVVLGGLWSWVAFGAMVALLHAGLAALAVSAGADKDGKPSSGSQVAFFVLAGLGVLGLLVTNIWAAGWWSLLWLGSLLSAPWPLKPIWRRDAELRGYTMSLYRIWRKYRHSWQERYEKQTIDRYVKHFTGPAYMFMELDGDYVRREFEFQMDRMKTGDGNEDNQGGNGFLDCWCWERKKGWYGVEQAEPFRMARSFMDEEGMYQR